jgi:hypothetical protein
MIVEEMILAMIVEEMIEILAERMIENLEGEMTATMIESLEGEMTEVIRVPHDVTAIRSLVRPSAILHQRYHRRPGPPLGLLAAAIQVDDVKMMVLIQMPLCKRPHAPMVDLIQTHRSVVHLPEQVVLPHCLMMASIRMQVPAR